MQNEKCKMKNAHRGSRSALLLLLFTFYILHFAFPVPAADARHDPRVRAVVAKGLDWLAAHQSRRGSWAAADGKYPTAMSAMAGIALLCEGSTTTQGKYAPNIRAVVDYLLARSRSNGLIGDPYQDDRYIYGHGFSMLFLS